MCYILVYKILFNFSATLYKSRTSILLVISLNPSLISLEAQSLYFIGRKIAKSLESEEPLTRFLFDDAAESRVQNKKKSSVFDNEGKRENFSKFFNGVL